jgi:hypothetical protein
MLFLRGIPGEALRQLEAAAPYELGCPPHGADFLPIYVRAEAYRSARDGGKAAGEYQRLIENRGVDPVSPLLCLAQLGLGRSYAMQGDKPKARTAYQDFLALWKDADADVPVLQAAQAEYAKLQ